MPRSSNRFCTDGSASTARKVALSFSTMSFGVSFGTQSPYQSEAVKPGRPASSTVGILGDDGNRVLPVTAIGLMLLVAISDLKLDDRFLMKLICPARRSCIAGALPR